MSERKVDEHTGVETTGHEWDGIRELDNPLPRWWLWVFWACVLWSVVYWVLMPAWPGLTGYTHGLMHNSARANVDKQLAELRAQRGAEAIKLKGASLEQIEKDPELQSYALALGASVFGDNCATCHGAGGTGGKGYPNLRDDVWLHGGTLEQIQHTITYGVRTGEPTAVSTQMPAFGRDQLLKENEIDDLTEYVVALSHRPANKAAVYRAVTLYRDQCASCHGVTGTGDQAKGAPNLTDNEWLYGPTRADIRGQIWNGRGGVMPTWGKRFDPETIKALTVYVHANAGGQ
ncbi:cytochrome-c oxidase, cbb3-type subunit III [Phenylobacterium soli]|uniref:Cbb3-type cytochrome c oxidase subunit n=1 Tax=Phenylobacterium soli TaxID=2170551 RepID=A0A328AKS3_9CAUL|nr:cytochrome-c oxidase, cbb3-type subunit III [Phenylobacterium soli]RAK54004.1 cytochrome-c oxidase, cbb3-type subunit III [Phenylobacterium soli]